MCVIISQLIKLQRLEVDPCVPFCADCVSASSPAQTNRFKLNRNHKSLLHMTAILAACCVWCLKNSIQAQGTLSSLLTL